MGCVNRLGGMRGLYPISDEIISMDLDANFGFAGAHGKIFVTGPLFNNARGTPIGEPTDFMQDGVPFQFEFVRQGAELRIMIDGRNVYGQDV